MREGDGAARGTGDGSEVWGGWRDGDMERWRDEGIGEWSSGGVERGRGEGGGGGKGTLYLVTAGQTEHGPGAHPIQYQYATEDSPHMFFLSILSLLSAVGMNHTPRSNANKCSMCAASL